MNHRILTAAAVLLCFAAPRIHATEPSAQIIEYGRYSSEIISLTPAENTSGNVLLQTKNVKHVETTKKIPARVGESFGLRIQYSNLPTDRDYVIHDVTFHPPIKQPNGTVLTQSSEDRKFKAGTFPPKNQESSRWTWVKGFEYELVPGEWTSVISVDGKEVTRFTFHVYEP